MSNMTQALGGCKEAGLTADVDLAGSLWLLRPDSGRGQEDERSGPGADSGGGDGHPTGAVPGAVQALQSSARGV